MENRVQHDRHIMFFFFEKGKNASKTCGKNVISLRMCQRWFSKFRSWHFSSEDVPHSSRPTKIDSDQIKVLIYENPPLTARNCRYSSGSTFKCYTTSAPNWQSNLILWSSQQTGHLGATRPDRSPASATDRYLLFVNSR